MTSRLPNPYSPVEVRRALARLGLELDVVPTTYVPYSGASTGVDLGSQTLTTTALVESSNLGIFDSDDTNARCGVSSADGASGSQNVAVGRNAFLGCDGSYNVFVGYDAGRSVTVDRAVAVGYNALRNSSSADYCIAVGPEAGRDATSTYSAYVGYLAGYQSAGQYTVSIGYYAGGRNAGRDFVGIGAWSGLDNKGAYCTLIGSYAGRQNEGTDTTGIGNQATRYNTGAYVTCIGSYSGQLNIGDYCILVGNSAGQKNSGDFNTSVGFYASFYSTCSDTVHIGFNCGRYDHGCQNTYIGSRVNQDYTGDAASAKTVDYTGVDAGTDRITFSSPHGFGSVGDYILVQVSTTGTLPGGLAASTTYQVKVVSTTVIGFRESDGPAVNPLIRGIDITSQGAGTHTVTPAVKFENCIAIGYSAENTKSNQAVIGTGSVDEIVLFGDVLLEDGYLAKYGGSASHGDGQVLVWSTANARFEVSNATGLSSLTNGSGVSAVIGEAVYISGGGSFGKAQADASSTARVVGLVGDASIANGTSGAVRTSGELTATTGQWDAVTGGAGGLVAGSVYYLDPSTSGRLTATAPTTAGQFVAEVGLALSTTKMHVNPKSPIGL